MMPSISTIGRLFTVATRITRMPGSNAPTGSNVRVQGRFLAQRESQLKAAGLPALSSPARWSAHRYRLRRRHRHVGPHQQREVKPLSISSAPVFPRGSVMRSCGPGSRSIRPVASHCWRRIVARKLGIAEILGRDVVEPFALHDDVHLQQTNCSAGGTKRRVR